MAENNQPKIANPVDIDEDDPFAELTRIMGFDPRLPLAQQREAVAADTARPAVVTPILAKAAAAPQPAAHDDFGIDLERELLGGLAEFDTPSEPIAPVVVAPAVARAVETKTAAFVGAKPAAVVEAKVVPVIEPKITRAVEAGQTPAIETKSAPAVEAIAPAAAVRVDEPDELDAMEAELAAAAESLVGDDLFEQAVAEDPEARALEPAPAVPFEMADSAFDDAIASALAEPSVEPVAAAGSQDDFEASTFAVEYGAADDAVDDAVAAEIEGRATTPADDELLPEFEIEDFEIHDSSLDAVSDERATAAADVSAVGETTTPGRDVGQPADPMASVDMDFSAAFESEFSADASVHDQQVVDRAALETAGHAPASAMASATDQLELSLEDELSALLNDDSELHQAAETAPIAPTAAAHSAPSRLGFFSDRGWSAIEAEEDEPANSRFPRTATPLGRSDAPIAEPRRPFGDPSLTGRHANYQLPPQPQPQPADDLDDLLDAMEHEVHAVEQSDEPAEEDQPSTYETASVVPADRFAPADRYAYGAAAYEFRSTADDRAEALPAETDHEVAPEIETVDVPETAVAMTDELDIPELAYEEARQPAAYDDIDADFAANFNETATSEEPVTQAARGVAHPTERTEFDEEFEALYGPAYAQDGATAGGEERRDARHEDFDDFDAMEPQSGADRERFVDLDFDDHVEEGVGPAYVAEQQAQRPRRRGLLIAAVIGGVALLGGVGALAVTFGGTGAPDVPVLVKADDGPIKIKPENPGGTVVPNQDNKVYDAVKGTAASAPAPAQEKLVTTSEEPVDMASVDQDNALPGVSRVEDIIAKSEDRVDPAVETDQDETLTESIAVAPRKVKTMMVRSDGTLVPREEQPMPAPEATAAAPTSSEEETGTLVATASDDPSFQPPAGQTVPVKPVKSTKITAEGGEAAPQLPVKAVKSTKITPDGQPQATPAESALPPANTTDEATAKPAEATQAQPVDSAAAATASEQAKQPEQVASTEPEPTTIATSPWSVQISSQPSAEAAKTTYEDLAKRYASVIGGRGVNIVKAQVEGKGTFWRVRVPAQSRNDANALCNDYKAAGGSCFISK